ncbi:hypothetical protein [Ligilactobacillus salivarius]|uniref:Uncharacterized protein n=1 Tax=Ligilactobacillus salivarius TaxID=1624 RepID=A0A9X6S681_9LACO|nr:hypothetical protein [Ligilactobacillus salivarius]PAY25869.1 hypothetical protein A8C33_09450 [Ligilactobacillus salivarius]PAY28282.1 hypothetical protein A8C49_08855 [Ligilactobacillus salivarius]PAY31380.1 hypothetical protein A8C44_05090 [Ligilactobacillus salivarius]PAY36743.1 hypothetical protein A8C50_04515 [Ligilactobacillus salivarius]PAY39089.1 hypothetical protein A8C51_02185 [Ligilactobacillus salivarius]
MESIFEVSVYVYDRTDYLIRAESILCSSRQAAEDMAENLALSYVKNEFQDEWNDYKESDLSRSFDDSNKLVSIKLQDKDIPEVTRLFIGVEQKQVFEDVRSYLDDRIEKNIENVPVDEVDTDEELKRWISEE